jgi:uncharacterized membrane protein (GlpM family)
MPPVLLIILVIIGIILLMAVQTVISKLKSPYIGGIIPLLILISAVCFYSNVNVDVSLSSLKFFVLPFFWSVEQWYKGRKKRTKRTILE